MYEAYPLQWPAGYKRTQSGNRIDSLFKQTMDKAQAFLKKEVERLDATDLIISTNIPVRRADGDFYSDYLKRKIDDPGVAIYFKVKGEYKSLCCDQYTRVWENMYALGKAIENLRGIERWGVSDFLAKAFTGFKALPEVSGSRIWGILGLPGQPANAAIIRTSYRRIARAVHPDAATGSHDAFAALQEAYRQALQIFNERP